MEKRSELNQTIEVKNPKEILKVYMKIRLRNLKTASSPQKLYISSIIVLRLYIK